GSGPGSRGASRSAAGRTSTRTPFPSGHRPGREGGIAGQPKGTPRCPPSSRSPASDLPRRPGPPRPPDQSWVSPFPLFPRTYHIGGVRSGGRLRWHLLVRPPLAVMPARFRQGVSVNEWTPPSEFDGYRIVRPLGRGGMGLVFLGHDTLLDRAVAIKFIAASEPGPEWRERFLTEGRAVARLSHPNVVAVYRVGEVSGHPYLITEYVDGETLAGIEKPVETEQLVRLAVGLTRGLAAAHEQGVLHRDLKPTNAMLARSGEPKLLDFGVAKLFDENGASATGVVDGVEEQSGAELSWTMSFNSPVSRALGTPMYMAPEVRAGAAASRRSDVFSLGAVLYELWTGNRFLQENG